MASGGGDGLSFEDYAVHVPKLREEFLHKFADNIKQDVYDERDIARIRDEDVWVQCFICHKRGSIEDAANQMDVSLKMRKSIGVNDIKESSFPQDFLDIGGIYFHSHDKDNRKILYFDVSKNDTKLTDTKREMIKKYLSYVLEHHSRKHPGERIVALMDMSAASLGNVDLDILKFEIACFTTYFPAVLEFIMMYEMSWIFNAIWRIVKTWLHPEQIKRVKFVKKNDVQEYINKEQLWVHMGGLDPYQYKYVPLDEEFESSYSISSLTQEGPSTPMATKTPMATPMATPMGSEGTSVRKRVTFAEQDLQSIDGSLDDADRLSMQSTLSRTGEKRTNKVSANVRLRTRDDSNMFTGSILKISPAELLEFEVTDNSRESLDVIFLHNTKDKQVAFKVKTTSPEKYRVRPSSGVINPSSCVEVNVYLLPGQDAIDRDKFLVLAMENPQNITGTQQINEMWRGAPRDAIMEHRLRCTLVSPSPDSEIEVEPESIDTDVLQKKLDQIIAQNADLGQRIERVYQIQMIFLAMILVCLILFILSYKWEVLPAALYRPQACHRSIFK